MYKTLLLLVILFFLVVFVSDIEAAESYWNQCSEGEIVRCETYDCPKGDTNKDGRCDLSDNDSRLQEAKNDAFCANPISGCGEVRYFTKNSKNACSMRVKESGSSCSLYKASAPSFTPVPTGTPVAITRPTATPSPKATVKSGFELQPTTVPSVKGEKLPETGVEINIAIIIALVGVVALYYYEKPEKTKHD